MKLFLALLFGLIPFVYAIGLIVYMYKYFKKRKREIMVHKISAYNPLVIIVYSAVFYLLFSVIIPTSLLIFSSKIAQPIIFSSSVAADYELGFIYLIIVYLIFYLPALFLLAVSSFFFLPIPLSLIKHSFPERNSRFDLFIRLCFGIVLVLTAGWLIGFMTSHFQYHYSIPHIPT